MNKPNTPTTGPPPEEREQHEGRGQVDRGHWFAEIHNDNWIDVVTLGTGFVPFRGLHSCAEKVADLLNERDDLLAQLEEARASIAVRDECIKKWGGHMAWCNVFTFVKGVRTPGPCHCGWAEWEAKLEPQPTVAQATAQQEGEE